MTRRRKRGGRKRGRKKRRKREIEEEEEEEKKDNDLILVNMQSYFSLQCTLKHSKFSISRKITILEFKTILISETFFIF